jgi:hypothetical protein
LQAHQHSPLEKSFNKESSIQVDQQGRELG